MKNSFHQRYIFSNHFKWSDKQKDHSTRVDHGSRDEIGRRKVGETNSEDVPRLVLIEQHSGLDFEMDDDKIHRVLDDRHEDRGDQYPRCGPRRPGIDSRTVVRRVSRQPISHRTLPAPAPPKVVSFSARSTTSGGCTTIKSSNWVGPPPPVIHRITSSPTRPALSYERIGHPSSGIFRMSLPQSLLDDGRLDAVITLAEDYINTTRHGSWTTELYSLTRQDIAMRQIPGMKTLIDPIVDMLTRTIESMYGCRKVLMDRNQPHMLKYSMDSAHTGGRKSQVSKTNKPQPCFVSPLNSILTFLFSFVLYFFESNFIRIDVT